MTCVKHAYICTWDIVLVSLYMYALFVYLWQDLPKGVLYMHSLRHAFHCYLITTPLDQQHICLILLKVDPSAFTQTSFSSLFEVHECLNGFQMPPSSLDKETAGCNSQHDWLMSVALGLAALCDMWRWKWHQWVSFGWFSEDVAFTCTLWLSTCPPPSHPMGVLVVLATPVEKPSKMVGNSATVLLNYNFIFPLMDTCGKTTRVR